MTKTLNTLMILLAMALLVIAPKTYGQLDAHDHSHSHTHVHTHAHTHNHGELLIMQQGNMWNMEFTIPAINAFGFEHKPQNKQQKQLIQGFIDKVAKPQAVIMLNGSCKLVSFEQQVSQLLVEDKDHHHGHDHHKGEDESHIDASFSYLFNCKNAPSAFSIKLFVQVKGLEQLLVQWITEQGQGAKTVSADKPQLVLSP